MSAAPVGVTQVTALPDHTQLPETDGSIKQNFQEHPQSMLLTDTVWPVLQQLHPDGQFAVGQDCGIYFRYTPRQPLEGCRAPDWFYVPDVPPLLDGKVRRSYVLWQEMLAPLLLVEFASGNGDEERDTTPRTGKFWIYERAIRAPFYAIYFADPGVVEVYHLVNQRYRRVRANARGHFPIPPLGVELGIWRGIYRNVELPWLRFWDAQGRLLPTSEERADEHRERAEQEKQRAEQERLRAEVAQEKADRLAARLRELGEDPDRVK
jgi:Putative restriction endonuclease